MNILPGFVTRSIRNKVIVLGSMIALLSSTFVVGLYYSRTEEIFLETAIEGLAGETRLMALKFQDSYDVMKNDAFVVSQTPPILGLIRSMENGGIDPLDGSSTRLWRDRLNAIFTSIMATRPHYTQMRYIGVANDGLELVRVNHDGAQLRAVPVEELQHKASEPYFKAGIALPRNGVYFSQLTYNREHGEIDPSQTPTVRVVFPIYSDSGALFGLVVINVDYRLMVREDLKTINQTKDTYIFNRSGDYIEFDAQSKAIFFEHHDNYTKSPPDYFRDLVSSPDNERVYVHEGEVTYFVRLAADDRNLDSYLGVVVKVPEIELMAATWEVGRDSILLSIGVVVLSMVLAGFAARRLTEPLVGMTSILSSAKGYDFGTYLPTHLDDEIGDLARAFQSLAGNLGESEAKAQAVLDTVVDGIITIDQYGTIDSFNPACEKIFGYRRDEVIGKNVGMLMPDSYRAKHDGYLHNYQKTGVRRIIGIGRELVGRRKDGEGFSLDLAISETLVRNRKIYTGIVRDITERKQIEMMKDEFISMVNHELRTPLTSIQASLGLLKVRSDKQLDEKGKRLLEISYENCGSLSNLVNDILDIEKIAAGKMEFHYAVAEMRDLVDRIVSKNFSYAEKYNINFDVISTSAEVHCLLDPDRFTQALLNLMSNAAKFSPEGGTVSIRMAGEGTDMLRISVSDTGPGIPNAFRSKIFERFAQADSSSTRAKGGSGLGLNITKSIIEAFGGTVSFQSVEGEGTTFHFLLPTCDREHDTSIGSKKWLNA